MSKHMIWMIIGCTIPLLLIFLAPALGLGGDWGLFIFIIAMFACHLFMMHGHHGHSKEHGSHKKESHEQHQG